MHDHLQANYALLVDTHSLKWLQHQLLVVVSQANQQAANVITQALQQLGGKFGGDPWAAIRSGIMNVKPHKQHSMQMSALADVSAKNGKLALSQFKRVKQLGSGDVGLVDLVELQSHPVR